MLGIDWRLPALLIAAMLLNAFFTWQQMKRYDAELNSALKAADGDSLVLCSGRGKSWRGGAIIILIVDTSIDQIVYAKGMIGRTVFARFKELPQLLGPTANAPDKIRGKQPKKAVEMALKQLTPEPPSCPTTVNTSRRFVRRRTSNRALSSQQN